MINVNDRRFSWLRNVFFKSFQESVNSVQQLQGNFTKDVDQKTFISWQTYQGLNISVNSIIEATQFLLWHQVKYLLAERFCQDPSKNWLGRQISLRLKKNNPGIADFEYS